MGTRQLPASVSVNSAILTIVRTFKWQKKKKIFSYLSWWAFYLVTGEALPPLTACHWLSGSYSRHAEFGDLVHLFPNLFCLPTKMFFWFPIPLKPWRVHQCTCASPATGSSTPWKRCSSISWPAHQKRNSLTHLETRLEQFQCCKLG